MLKMSKEKAVLALSYNPETGELRWKSTLSYRFKNGSIAGYIDKTTGYRRVGINGSYWKAHRLAWLIHYGYLPDCEIDHINGDRSDNRICNLREATRSENQHNRKAQKNNTSGVKGVNFHNASGKWRAECDHENKRYYLGLFESKELAMKSVVEFRKLNHKSYANNGDNS